MYTVGQQSKLLILSEYVNKTDKIQDEREQLRTAIKKMKHCLTFSREIFLRHNCFMFKYSMTESSQ